MITVTQTSAELSVTTLIITKSLSHSRRSTQTQTLVLTTTAFSTIMLTTTQTSFIVSTSILDYTTTEDDTQTSTLDHTVTQTTELSTLDVVTTTDIGTSIVTSTISLPQATTTVFLTQTKTLTPVPITFTSTLSLTQATETSFIVETTTPMPITLTSTLSLTQVTETAVIDETISVTLTTVPPLPSTSSASTTTSQTTVSSSPSPSFVSYVLVHNNCSSDYLDITTALTAAAYAVPALSTLGVGVGDGGAFLEFLYPDQARICVSSAQNGDFGCSYGYATSWYPGDTVTLTCPDGRTPPASHSSTSTSSTPTFLGTPTTTSSAPTATVCPSSIPSSNSSVLVTNECLSDYVQVGTFSQTYVYIVQAGCSLVIDLTGLYQNYLNFDFPDQAQMCVSTALQGSFGCYYGEGLPLTPGDVVTLTCPMGSTPTAAPTVASVFVNNEHCDFIETTGDYTILAGQRLSCLPVPGAQKVDNCFGGAVTVELGVTIGSQLTLSANDGQVVWSTFTMPDLVNDSFTSVIGGGGLIAWVSCQPQVNVFLYATCDAPITGYITATYTTLNTLEVKNLTVPGETLFGVLAGLELNFAAFYASNPYPYTWQVLDPDLQNGTIVSQTSTYSTAVDGGEINSMAIKFSCNGTCIPGTTGCGLT